MQRVPVFPIPGDGKFLRQPLYGGDFADIIAAALESEITGAYNITGQEKVDYIDLIRAVKAATNAPAQIVKLPYRLFKFLLETNAIFDKNPAFTVKELEALITPDVFEVIDWPSIFNVHATPLAVALNVTFRDPNYSMIVLDFKRQSGQGWVKFSTQPFRAVFNHLSTKSNAFRNASILRIVIAGVGDLKPRNWCLYGRNLRCETRLTDRLAVAQTSPLR